jgi:hypothetical protein
MADNSHHLDVQHQEEISVIHEKYETQMILKVKAVGFVISKDGNMWEALLGANPMEGDAFYDETYMGVVRKAFYFLTTPLPSKEKGL